MRVGGSKQKGSAAERLVGHTLSLWLTNGKRADLFSRTVLSGGRWTRQAKTGDVRGLPGDLMAADPLAFEFMSLFSIECKHRRSIDLAHYLTDPKGGSFLAKTVQQARHQAWQAGREYIVVAKENNHRAIMLMSYKAGSAAVVASTSTRRRLEPTLYHQLHIGLGDESVTMFRLDQFVERVNPKLFISTLHPGASHAEAAASN